MWENKKECVSVRRKGQEIKGRKEGEAESEREVEGEREEIRETSLNMAN